MSNSRITRRACLSAALVPALAALAPEALAELVEEAQTSGKPLLRHATLNRRIGMPETGGLVWTQTVQQAHRNLRKFLNDNFTLTNAQRKEIASIPREDLKALNALLTEALEKRVPIRVHKLKDEEKKLEAKKQEKSGGTFEKILGVTIPGKTVYLHMIDV